MLESVERTRRAALADAQKAEGSEGQDRLRHSEILCERAPISLLCLKPSIDPTVLLIDTERKHWASMMFATGEAERFQIFNSPSSAVPLVTRLTPATVLAFAEGAGHRHLREGCLHNR